MDVDGRVIQDNEAVGGRFAVSEPPAPAVEKDLTFSVTSDKDIFGVGELAVFELTAYNWSAVPRTVEVSWHLAHNYDGEHTAALDLAPFGQQTVTYTTVVSSQDAVRAQFADEAGRPLATVARGFDVQLMSGELHPAVGTYFP